MWPGIITGKTQRRTATALKVGLCAACEPSKFIIIRFFGQSLLADHSVPAAAFGMIIPGWVEILLMAHIPPCLITGNMVPLADKLTGWGNADGENGWDKNDPHGLYFSGTAASNTTTRQPRNIYRYRIDSPGRLQRDADSERSRRIGLLPYIRLLSLVIPPQRLPIIITAVVIEVRRFCSMPATNSLSATC